MSETHVAHLMKAVSTLPQTNNTYRILESFYMMKCKEITKGFHLPLKYFSNKVRCPHCCVLWRSNSEIKVRSNKLNTNQRRRLKYKMKTNKNGQVDTSILQSNNLEQICSFCKHSTITPIMKPNKSQLNEVISFNKNEQKDTKTIEQKKIAPNFASIMPAKISNVYKNTKDILSIQNKSNTIESTIKTKVVKNNKKKKDKFAGLCQKAVLAAAKMKEDTNKQNKLNLFLKPSS